jgi:trigger factor
MMVTVESTGTLERRMRVELPAERVEKEVESRLKSVGKTAKIKGFRPGKIPANVVRQRYGTQVRQEVLSELMGQSYRDAVLQENLNPVAHPKIEPDMSDDGDGFAFVATFEVLPEFTLEGLEKIEVTRPDVEISDEDCDDMLENLRKQKATWKTVERESRVGDRVVVDFDGQLKGEPVEGGKGSEVPVVLGQGQMLPDFEKGLVGVKGADEKSFKVKFPKDYHADELANKKVDFTVKVHSVDEEELPPLDDSLAEVYGVEKGGLSKLRQDVLENMEREAEQKVRNDIREQALTGLLDANPIEVPKSLVQREAHSLQHDAMRQLGIEEHDKAPPMDEFTESAEKRVRQICAGYENAEEMVQNYMSTPQVMERLEPMVTEEQAVEWIIENGVENTKQISFKEYMKP